MERFNILLLWTDQQRADTLACLGGRGGVMPHVDALSEDCTVFPRAYCTSPVCTPSRGSVLTGLMPHAHGAYANKVPLGADVACLPELLRACGSWATGYVGKWHLGDEFFAQHGFERWIASEDGYQEHFSEGRDRSLVSDYQRWAVGRGYLPDGRDRWLRDWSMKMPERDSKPAFIVEQAMSFVEGCADRPWMLSVNTLEPHHPLTGPCGDCFSPEEVDETEDLCFRAAEAPLFVKASRARWASQGMEDFHLRDRQSWKQLRAHYMGQCHHVDRQFGRLLGYLKKMGQYDRTLIVYCSDHGEMMGGHGLFGKCVPYEGAVRVPLMVKLPGQRVQRRYDSPVSLADIVPTVLDAAGGWAAGFHGRSLLEACSGGSPGARDELVMWLAGEALAVPIVSEAKDLGEPGLLAASVRSNWRTLVTPEGLKYTLMDAGEQMLHDVLQTPQELCDLVGRTPAGELHRLRERLGAVMRRVGDGFSWPGEVVSDRGGYNVDVRFFGLHLGICRSAEDAGLAGIVGLVRRVVRSGGWSVRFDDGGELDR